jgi:hypothetical protein
MAAAKTYRPYVTNVYSCAESEPGESSGHGGILQSRADTLIKSEMIGLQITALFERDGENCGHEYGRVVTIMEDTER